MSEGLEIDVPKGTGTLYALTRTLHPLTSNKFKRENVNDCRIRALFWKRGHLNIFPPGNFNLPCDCELIVSSHICRNRKVPAQEPQRLLRSYIRRVTREWSTECVERDLNIFITRDRKSIPNLQLDWLIMAI